MNSTWQLGISVILFIISAVLGGAIWYVSGTLYAICVIIPPLAITAYSIYDAINLIREYGWKL